METCLVATVRQVQRMHGKQISTTAETIPPQCGTGTDKVHLLPLFPLHHCVVPLPLPLQNPSAPFFGTEYKGP